MADRWVLMLLVIGLLLYFGVAIVVAANNLAVDFYTYLIAAYGFSHGINVYASADFTLYDQIAKQLGIADYGGRYYNPLLTAAIVSPLLRISLEAGAVLWIFGNGVSALAAALILGRSVVQAWKRRLILMAAIGYAPILATLRTGNVNVLALLATATAIYAWRQYRERIGGVSLALGLWFKPFAFALVGLMLWRWRFRSLGWILLTSLALTVCSIWVFGIWPAMGQFSAPFGARDLLNLNVDPDNQNLNGVIARFLIPGEEGIGGLPLVNAPQIAVLLYWILAGTLIVSSLSLIWPIGTGSQSIGLEAALLISTTHLVFPFTSYYHLAMILIPIALLMETWHGLSWSILALIVAYFLIDLQGVFLAIFTGRLFTFPPLMGISHSVFSFQIGFVGEAIIWVLLARLLLKNKQGT
jgi:hypothetical protein